MAMMVAVVMMVTVVVMVAAPLPPLPTGQLDPERKQERVARFEV